MYTSIEIDFDVYKELTMRRDSPETTENDVLRDLLGLEEKQQDEDEHSEPAESRLPWSWKGVQFPHGTKFKAEYKGQTYFAKAENGALVYDGERYKSPSAAARAVTGSSVNGWRFWECKLPGGTKWKLIDRVRKEQAS